jgi:uncharacterized protein YbbK (DUF523 family)
MPERREHKSQQPRETGMPTPRERSAVVKEDHTKERQKLTDEKAHQSAPAITNDLSRPFIAMEKF